MKTDQNTVMAGRYGFEKHQVRHAFEQASGGYDRFTQLQRDIGAELLERLALFRLQPRRILDVGCGTGWLTRQLMDQYPKAQVYALDLSTGMLNQAAQHNRWRRKMGRICGDAESLPLRNHQFDLVFSNLALQWCARLGEVFSEFQRVLNPGGLLMFSSFGPLTLNELRQAWAYVDDLVHVNQFVDMHDVGDSLMQAGLVDSVVDVERMRMYYDNVYGLMRDLKGMGAHNVNQGRASGLTTPSKLKQMLSAYERYRDTQGLPASFEAVFGHALAADRQGSQSVGLSGLEKGFL